MIRRSTYGLILFLILGVFQAQAQWEQVRYRGNMYVTLDSFCDFYSFKHAGTEGEKTNLFNGTYGTLKLTDDGREAYINGRKVWLALNMVTNESGKRLISYVDVVKLMEPVLRPNKVKKLRPIKGVVIDAGHGGTDNGARGRYGLMEKDMTLDTALRLEKILKSVGIPVVLTRRTDVFVPLEQRAAIAAQYPNYLFVSIHFNQGQSEASGIETFALTPQYAPSTDSAGVMRVSDATRENGNRNDEANILLADFIHQEVRKLHPVTGDRGVKRARFVVLRLNSLPSTLVEGGFLSNPGDARMIGSTTYRDKLANGIAKGVRRFIALSKGDAGTDSPDANPGDDAGTLARPPVPPEPPRPLDAKPGDQAKSATDTGKAAPDKAKPGAKPDKTSPATPAKPTVTPDASSAKATPATAAKTPASDGEAPTAKPKTTDKTANKATDKTTDKTPDKTVDKTKSTDKTKSGDKAKTTEKAGSKPAAKPVAKPVEVPADIPQMNASPAPVESPAVTVEPAEPLTPSKPTNVPMIETAPPVAKKPSGPVIETSPAPRAVAPSTPAPLPDVVPVPTPVAPASTEPAAPVTPERAEP